jgi:hypothetical protein
VGGERETWWLEAAFRATLEARRSVAEWMALAADGTLLSSDRQSATARVGDLLVKWRRPRAGRRWRTLLRPSRERREALAASGPFPWPRPLAVGERRRGGLLVASALVRPFLPGRTAAEADDAGGDRVVQALRAWHDAGFRHGDCYPKNVLLTPDAVVPLGAPKARWVRPGPRWDRARAKDLAQWAAGREGLGLEPLAFLTAYLAAAPGLSVEGHARERIGPRLRRIRTKKRRREATRPGREPLGPPRPLPLPPDPKPLPRREIGLPDLPQRRE